MTHVELAFPRFSHRRKRFRQQIIKSCTLIKALPELARFGAQIMIGELVDLGFELIDLLYQGLQPLEFPLVFAAKDFFEQSVQHSEDPSLRIFIRLLPISQAECCMSSLISQATAANAKSNAKSNEDGEPRGVAEGERADCRRWLRYHV